MVHEPRVSADTRGNSSGRRRMAKLALVIKGE
jgi:hypothetical protein